MGIESHTCPVPLNISAIVVAATAEMAVAKTAAVAAGTGVAEKKTTALAPGFRFHPTDEELVIYYLKRRVSNKPFRFNAIAEVDIYKNEPWDLADKASLRSRDQEWYFFSPLDKKYGNGARMNRATGRGYWKATGKDREIRRDSKLLAMKKTLVFHSGRAPGGQRTNWVMHEYRLVDEELERTGACFRALEKPGSVQFDSYVLCRVFHKNNIGPPTGNRYAPFLEEEWDDGKSIIVPREDALDEVVGTRGICVDLNNSEQDTNSLYKDPPSGDEIPKDPQLTLSLFKDEKTEDNPRECIFGTEAPFRLLQYKRRKQSCDNMPNHSNGSESSGRMSQDPCSSTTTTAATPPTSTTDTIMTTSATTAAVSALLEFSLMEPVEPKEKPQVIPSVFEAANLDSLVPPSCSKFIKDLQNEVHKVSVDREKLKLEMMSAQAMINILQSRIESLDKENEDLKRTIQDKC